MKIDSFERIVPMIYAYTTPGVVENAGLTKVGYTEKQSVADRIRQQTHTAHITAQIVLQDNAIYKDGSGEYFTDHDFHSYLVRHDVERVSGTEWFRTEKNELKDHFDTFAARQYSQAEGMTYELRAEQEEAVTMTYEYFKGGGEKFLWNAKPRFGKTLCAYELIMRMNCDSVLILTNRPSISNSWAEDYYKYVGWRGQLSFVSDTDAVSGKKGVQSRREYLDMVNPKDTMRAAPDNPPGMIVFESLQGLKGSRYFGGDIDKLDYLAKEYINSEGRRMEGQTFDLLIIDEAHEGVDTVLTERALRNISRKHTLYLSGTAFKAIASESFRPEEIYNWTYADEQQAKADWGSDDYNPYERLPSLNMYTYQISNMLEDRLSSGMALDEDEDIDFAFDLNEFFSTNESGKFVHEDEVQKFLHALTTNEKYPYSTDELRAELSHTLWLLDRVDSARALARMLKSHEIFSEYEIVLAAGDGRLDEAYALETSYDRVQEAIRNYDKTITLSVGQLTVGVTIPQWSGVLMLCNLKSAASYMQAAFRTQNPCVIRRDGVLMRKERAYVFDFDPARTLIIFDEFANNLCLETADGRGSSDDRETHIKRLLNFFPVIGEDPDGKMVELNVTDVLSIPRRIKSRTVVQQKFMSNFLFQNISRIFHAPSAIKDIVEKLTLAREEPVKKTVAKLEEISQVQVDGSGDVVVPHEIVIGRSTEIFGDKKYEELIEECEPHVSAIASSGDSDEILSAIDRSSQTIKDIAKQEIIEPIASSYDIKKGMKGRLERQLDRHIDDQIEEMKAEYKRQEGIARLEYDRKLEVATSDDEVQEADRDYASRIAQVANDIQISARKLAEDTIKNKPTEVVEQVEKYRADRHKKDVEDVYRGHLRGFARTIPSFVMAYGDENLKLRNIDEYVDDEVFREVTGITHDEFRFLRDGGEYEDEGQMKHFEGHLFDEVVFDDSIAEFLQKKSQLADYFSDTHEEDIFDYIPPQKNNQIFTPKAVVRDMVDMLEAENPGCFDDPEATFADLYMKSGMYITEIVRRLYRSEKMRQAYPDDRQRLRHIFERQVYGCAPSEIIYCIALSYILGFVAIAHDEYAHHIIKLDTLEYAKDGTLEQRLKEEFGIG